MNLRPLTLCLLGLLGLLAGCSSAPARYYTLMADSSLPITQPSAVNFELQVVRVPLQVDQPQLVVRRAAGELAILDHERWAAPLADEFHDALASQLERQLGRRDLAGMPKPAGLPLARISVAVRRFDSVEGQQAGLDAVWNLRLSEPGGQLATSHARPHCTSRPRSASQAW